jgi:hypothetical protein
MSGQLELFAQRHIDPNPVLDAMLYDFPKDWIPASRIAECKGIDEREVRVQVAASDGRIISGDRGYKLMDFATIEEINHYSRRMIAHGRAEVRKGIRALRRYHNMNELVKK